MPTADVLLSISSTDYMEISPYDLIISQSEDTVNFTAKGSSFTVTIKNDDSFFVDEIPAWSATISDGRSVQTPRINMSYTSPKTYAVGCSDANPDPGQTSPPKIIIGRPASVRSVTEE